MVIRPLSFHREKTKAEEESILPPKGMLDGRLSPTEAQMFSPSLCPTPTLQEFSDLPSSIHLELPLLDDEWLADMRVGIPHPP